MYKIVTAGDRRRLSAPKLIKTHFTPPKPKLKRVRRLFARKLEFCCDFRRHQFSLSKLARLFQVQPLLQLVFEHLRLQHERENVKIVKILSPLPRQRAARNFPKLFFEALNNVHVVRGPFSVDFCSSNLSAAFLFSFVSTLTIFFGASISSPKQHTTDIRHHHNLSSLSPYTFHMIFIHDREISMQKRKKHLVFVTIK